MATPVLSHPNLILYNGIVATQTPKYPMVQALAASCGRIMAVGGSDDILDSKAGWRVFIGVARRIMTDVTGAMNGFNAAFPYVCTGMTPVTEGGIDVVNVIIGEVPIHGDIMDMGMVVVIVVWTGTVAGSTVERAVNGMALGAAD